MNEMRKSDDENETSCDDEGDVQLNLVLLVFVDFNFEKID